MKPKQTSEEKYLEVLEHLANRKRGFPSIHKFLAKHRVSISVGTILHRLNLIEKKNGTWKWIGQKPDSLLAGKILFEVNKYIKIIPVRLANTKATTETRVKVKPSALWERWSKGKRMEFLKNKFPHSTNVNFFADKDYDNLSNGVQMEIKNYINKEKLKEVKKETSVPVDKTKTKPSQISPHKFIELLKEDRARETKKQIKEISLMSPTVRSKEQNRDVIDIIDITSLKKERVQICEQREKLLKRLNKIDSFLELAKDFKK